VYVTGTTIRVSCRPSTGEHVSLRVSPSSKPLWRPRVYWTTTVSLGHHIDGVADVGNTVGEERNRPGAGFFVPGICRRGGRVNAHEIAAHTRIAHQVRSPVPCAGAELAREEALSDTAHRAGPASSQASQAPTWSPGAGPALGYPCADSPWQPTLSSAARQRCPRNNHVHRVRHRQ
jgi:hypothetical protein